MEKMATCDAGHGCSITCPDGCGAIYWHNTGECDTWCTSKESALPGEKSVSAVEGKIDLCVKDMRLVDLALFIDNVQPTKIAIPASRAYESVTIDLKETTVDNVIKSLGLMPV